MSGQPCPYCGGLLTVKGMYKPMEVVESVRSMFLDQSRFQERLESFQLDSEIPDMSREEELLEAPNSESQVQTPEHDLDGPV